MEELDKLREAHACLISMIKNHDLHIKDKSSSTMSATAPLDQKKNGITEKPIETMTVGDLLSCGLKKNDNKTKKQRSPNGSSLQNQ